MAGIAKAFAAGNSPNTPASPKKGIANANIAVSSTQSECDSLDFTGYRFMAVKPPTSVTSLTFYGSETIGGTYVLIDSLGTNGAVTVAASKWNVIDGTKIAPFSFIQMVSNQAVANASICATS